MSKEEQVRKLIMELCNVKTWEGVNKQDAGSVYDSYVRRIMEVFK